MWRVWSITKYNKAHIYIIYIISILTHVTCRRSALTTHIRASATPCTAYRIPHFQVNLPIHDHGYPASSTTGWVFFGLKNKGLLNLATKRFNFFWLHTGKWPVHVTHSLVQYLPIRKIMYTQINAGKRIFFRRIWHFFPGSFQIWLFFPIRLAHSPARKFQKE